jgi:ABC-type molybdate transport system substrate-binding protein
MKNKLTILSAGVAMQLVKDTAEQWNAAHPDFPAEYEFGGSVDLARRIIAGDVCDFFISADDTLITQLLIPRFSDECVVFAHNKMVIAAVIEGKTISSDNWQQTLLDPKTRFAHFNPYDDPGGYRAVMSILLADNVTPGLSQKLMEHPGHIGMDKNLKKDTIPPHDYLFMYYSGAAQRGLPFAELPAVMDLSDPALESVYNSVNFSVDENHVISGSCIRHACAIPTTSTHKNEASAFKELFLSADFKRYYFL